MPGDLGKVGSRKKLERRKLERKPNDVEKTRFCAHTYLQERTFRLSCSKGSNFAPPLEQLEHMDEGTEIFDL